MCGLNRTSVRFRITRRRKFSMSKLSHFGKGVGPPRHLFKLGFTSPKDALYQFWLKMAQWFWRRTCKYGKMTHIKKYRRTD